MNSCFRFSFTASPSSERETPGQLYLSRCVVRSEYVLQSRCVRIVISLNIEGIECIHIEAQVHFVLDWKYLIQREVDGVVERAIDPGLRQIVADWPPIVGNRRLTDVY